MVGKLAQALVGACLVLLANEPVAMAQSGRPWVDPPAEISPGPLSPDPQASPPSSSRPRTVPSRPGRQVLPSRAADRLPERADPAKGYVMRRPPGGSSRVSPNLPTASYRQPQ